MGAVTAWGAEPSNSHHQRRIDHDGGPSPEETMMTCYPTGQKVQAWNMVNSENVSMLSVSDLVMVY